MTHRPFAVRPVGFRMVVAAVAIAALAALLLWSVERSRQAALRSQCLKNLQLVGRKIDSYTKSHKAYPSGTLPDASIPPNRRQGWGVLVYALVEEGCSGCPAIDITQPWDHPSVRVDALFRSAPMCCPSGPKRTLAVPLVPASYVGIAGLGPDAPGLPTRHPRAGLFGDDRRVTPADVADGLANTMMVVDTAAPSGPWFAGGRATVRGVDPASRPQIGRGRPFGGVHGEGAVVLMADGSVRWERRVGSPAVFEAESTIAGGEVVVSPNDAP